MGNRDKARAALYVMVGGYLLYLAYKLFSTRAEYNGSNATVMLIFAIFFLGVGVAILGLAFYISRKSSSQNMETVNEDTKEDCANALEGKADSLESNADLSKEGADNLDNGGE